MKMGEQSYVFLIFRVGFSIFKEAYTNFNVRAGCLAGARRVARKTAMAACAWARVMCRWTLNRNRELRLRAVSSTSNLKRQRSAAALNAKSSKCVRSSIRSFATFSGTRWVGDCYYYRYYLFYYCEHHYYHRCYYYYYNYYYYYYYDPWDR